MKVVQTKMRFQVVEITPEEAQAFLDKNHPNNRKPKKGRIEQYMRDMVNGHWLLTHQTVAIDEDGWLIDGQNRLAAIVRAGVPVVIVLATGVPRKAMIGADCGTVRNVADAARIIDQPFAHGDTTFGAVARRMAIGMGRHKAALSIPETLEFVEKHRDAIEFAFKVFHLRRVRGITQAPVLAAVARAYYRRGCRERLKEFGNVMLDGMTNNQSEDSAAVRLRNWLLQHVAGGKRRTTASMYPVQHIVYARAEQALRYFLDRKALQILRETKEELFPIAEDAEEEEELYEGNGQA